MSSLRNGRRCCSARAREPLECRESRIQVRPVGGGGYLAEGCGRRQSYTCIVDRSGWVCVADGPAEDTESRHGSAERAEEHTTSALPEATSSSPGEDARLARAALTRCAIEAEVTIAITIERDGRVGRTETPGLGGDSGRCVVSALRETRFAARSREEVALVTLAPHAAERPAAEAPGGATTETPSAVEAAVRNRVTELAPSILASTSSVAAGGARGVDRRRCGDVAFAGRADRNAGGRLRAGDPLVPAPGASGSVLHAVR